MTCCMIGDGSKEVYDYSGGGMVTLGHCLVFPSIMVLFLSLFTYNIVMYMLPVRVKAIVSMSSASKI